MNTTCICVLNYNNGAKTISCLRSILSQSVDNLRIVIIDNHSTDDSLKLIQTFLENEHQAPCYINNINDAGEVFKTPGQVVIIPSDVNGGYGSGNNMGIRLAKSSTIFTHVLIINNDILLEKDFLEQMQKRYETLQQSYKSKHIALGATELGHDGAIHHHGFHYIHLLTGITFFKPYWPSFKYIVGSCMFTDIGAPLMDESFFLYFDDTQYSKILLRNNYILDSSPDSYYVHEVGGTPKHNIQLQIFKSLLHFYRLNYFWLLPVVFPVRLMLLGYLWLKPDSKR